MGNLRKADPAVMQKRSPRRGEDAGARLDGAGERADSASRQDEKMFAGLGRFDIALQPLDPQLPGFIFELKASRKQKEDLEILAQTALAQIDEKWYEMEMHRAGVENVIKMGVAFRGKEVVVKES